MNIIKTTQINESLIDNIVAKIAQNFHPQKIILFGSYVWGNPYTDSDLDFLVIMDSYLRRDNRSLEISRLFSDRKFPLDIIVYTPDEIKISTMNGNPFIKNILEKGKVLYAK